MGGVKDQFLQLFKDIGFLHSRERLPNDLFGRTLHAVLKRFGPKKMYASRSPLALSHQTRAIRLAYALNGNPTRPQTTKLGNVGSAQGAVKLAAGLTAVSSFTWPIILQRWNGNQRDPEFCRTSLEGQSLMQASVTHPWVRVSRRRARGLYRSKARWLPGRA